MTSLIEPHNEIPVDLKLFILTVQPVVGTPLEIVFWLFSSWSSTAFRGSSLLQIACHTEGILQFACA